MMKEKTELKQINLTNFWVMDCRVGRRYRCSFKPRKAVRKGYLEMGLNRPGEGNKQREAKYTSNEEYTALSDRLITYNYGKSQIKPW